MPLLLDLVWRNTQTIVVLLGLRVPKHTNRVTGLQLAKCTCHMRSTVLPRVLWRSITNHHTVIAPLR